MESIVRRNLMADGSYTPYCGNLEPRIQFRKGCFNPRTVFNGNQFVCPNCGFQTKFEKEFIDKYKELWKK